MSTTDVLGNKLEQLQNRNSETRKDLGGLHLRLERRNYTPHAGFEEKLLGKIAAVNATSDLKSGQILEKPTDVHAWIWPTLLSLSAESPSESRQPILGNPAWSG
jgi:hypothetical protein